MPSLTRRAPTRPLVAVLFAALAGLVWAPSAEAHTAFESSNPADGSVVDTPVDRIVITFTGEATEAGEGFVVLTPQGELIEPPVTRGADGRAFTLTIDPPVAGGEIGVRWTVRAADAHPIEGSFSFTSTAAVPTATPTSTPPPLPSATAEPTVAPTTGSRAPTAVASATSAPTASPTATGPPAAGPISAEQVDDETAAPTMQEFLAGDDGFDPGRPFGWIGRPLSVVGSLTVLGLVAFHTLTLRKPVGGIAVLNRVLVASGALLTVGAVSEGLWHALGDADGGLGTSAGVATGLRAVGGLAIVAILIVTRSKGAASGAALAAGSLILGSWAFDGHTVSEGNRWLTSIVDLVHVAGAAVWVGGVVGLLVVRHEPQTELAPWVLRFSVLATGAVVVVGLAGVALTVTILDSFGDLWTTTWGRVLIAKLVFVGVAGAAGAYNHFVLVPQLRTDPDAPAARLWAVLRVEAVALVAVAVLTGALIASSTV